MRLIKDPTASWHMNILYNKLHPSWKISMETMRTNTFTHLNCYCADMPIIKLTPTTVFVKNSSAHNNKTGDLVADTEGLLASHEGTFP